MHSCRRRPTIDLGATDVMQRESPRASIGPLPRFAYRSEGDRVNWERGGFNTGTFPCLPPRELRNVSIPAFPRSPKPTDLRPRDTRLRNTNHRHTTTRHVSPSPLVLLPFDRSVYIFSDPPDAFNTLPGGSGRRNGRPVRKGPLREVIEYRNSLPRRNQSSPSLHASLRFCRSTLDALSLRLLSNHLPRLRFFL
jgi:hypothetical protein